MDLNITSRFIIFDGMVRHLIPTVHPIFPPKPHNYNSNSTSLKQRFLTLLNLCSSSNHLHRIHAQIQISGLHVDEFISSELVRFFALSSSSFANLKHARLVLDHSQSSTTISWNVLIRGYSNSEFPKEAVWVYLGMRRRGVRPNHLTFPFLFKACSSVFGFYDIGRQVHVDVVKHGLDRDVYVQNTMVHFYGSCKKVSDAKNVFDEMFERSVVSWNSMICACVENSLFDEAVGVFVKMRGCEVEYDETTMVILLSACAELGHLNLGKWFHSQVIGRGMFVNFQLGTALVDMYAKSGSMEYARLVFNNMVEKNVWTWSAMILGLAQHGFAKDALQLYLKMKSSYIRPNYVTFLGILCACSHAGLVDDGYRFFNEMKHVYRIKPMMIHYGAMVDILGRAGRLQEAYSFIKNMPIEADPIIWRTLLSACSVHDVKDHEGVGEAVKTMLLELEPRRSGNFVIVANMYADVGMWEKAASTRRVMRDGGLKKMAGESCVYICGSVHKFFSGDDYRGKFEDIYLLLDVLRLQMKNVESFL